MLISFEGVSSTGKSTTIKNVKELLTNESDFNVMTFKGNGQIRHPNDWKEYNKWMHNMLFRILNLNDDLVVLGDRVFTEAVITEDKELLRRYKCYDDNAKVIYLEADSDDLEQRNNLDIDTDNIKFLYEKMLNPVFETEKINTSEMSIEAVSNSVFQTICNWKENE